MKVRPDLGFKILTIFGRLAFNGKEEHFNEKYSR